MLALAFAIPAAGADVCFAGHCIKGFEAQWLRTLVALRALAVVSAVLSGGAKGEQMRCGQRTLQHLATPWGENVPRLPASAR